MVRENKCVSYTRTRAPGTTDITYTFANIRHGRAKNIRARIYLSPAEISSKEIRYDRPGDYRSKPRCRAWTPIGLTARKNRSVIFTAYPSFAAGHLLAARPDQLVSRCPFDAGPSVVGFRSPSNCPFRQSSRRSPCKLFAVQGAVVRVNKRRTSRQYDEIIDEEFRNLSNSNFAFGSASLFRRIRFRTFLNVEYVTGRFLLSYETK